MKEITLTIVAISALAVTACWTMQQLPSPVAGGDPGRVDAAEPFHDRSGSNSNQMTPLHGSSDWYCWDQHAQSFVRRGVPLADARKAANGSHQHCDQARWVNSGGGEMVQACELGTCPPADGNIHDPYWTNFWWAIDAPHPWQTSDY